MASFTYTARGAKGELKNATIEATSREEAITQLRKQRLNVIKIDEQQKRKKPGKVSMRDIVIFTRQFSTMINAGLPLVQAMGILAEQSENPSLREITKQVVFDVKTDEKSPTGQHKSLLCSLTQRTPCDLQTQVDRGRSATRRDQRSIGAREVDPPRPPVHPASVVGAPTAGCRTVFPVGCSFC